MFDLSSVCSSEHGAFAPTNTHTHRSGSNMSASRSKHSGKPAGVGIYFQVGQLLPSATIYA